MTLYAEVALPLPLNQTFFYTVPELWKEQAKIGTRVLVPLGERALTGIVINLRKRRLERSVELKEIKEVLDEKPVFSLLFLSFTRKLSDYYYTFWGELLQASLPTSHIVKSKTTTFLTEKGKEALRKEGLSSKERAVLSLLQRRAYTPLFIQRKLGVKNTSSLLSQLERKGFIHILREVKRAKRRKMRSVGTGQSQLEIDFGLDRDSLEIAEQISQKEGKKIFSPFLLFAPKDKREAVYFYLIKNVLAREERALFLVPEISLTKYPLERLKKGLGKNIALLHSQMSERAREVEWQKVQNGEAEVVVGSRSALFSPVSRLGLIIVDEEHDESYYQQESPSYDARRGAWLRAREEKAVLVYGSAKPSVEAFYRAKKGSYLVNMEKYKQQRRVFTVEEKRRGRGVGQFLRERIEEKLKKEEQVLVFINRRGYAPLLLCSRCSYIPKCIHCDISLTYHKKEERLVCHYCNYSLSKMEVCPECKGRIIKMMGIGIEAVEEELEKFFPQSRVASLVSDEARTRKEQERMIRSFSKGEINILVGTQLLAHQVGLPSVSLVAILYPETLLGFSDFRASQKTFQTISRMMGFCRDDSCGEVIIQTALPSHFSIRASATQDYISFFNQEIKVRRLMNYPPFSHVIGIVFQGKNVRTLAKKSREFSTQIKKRAEDIEVLGPALASVTRLRGVNRIQMILKAKKRKLMDEVVKESLKKVRFRGTISVLS